MYLDPRRHAILLPIAVALAEGGAGTHCIDEAKAALRRLQALLLTCLLSQIGPEVPEDVNDIELALPVLVQQLHSILAPELCMLLAQSMITRLFPCRKSSRNARQK